MRERLVNTPDEVERLFRMLNASDRIIYDAETSGLDWKTNHIVGHVITPYGEDSMYVPVRHAGGGNLPGCQVPNTPTGYKEGLHPFEVEFAKICSTKHRHWIGHNFIFDLRFLFKHKINLYGKYEDTMINAPLIDENQRGFSLDACAKVYGVQAKKGEELYKYISSQFGGEPSRKSMEHFWRTDGSKREVWDYAAGDGVTTEGLWERQMKDIEEQQLERVHDVECRLIKTLFRMTSNGIRIDEEELHRVDKLFESRIKEASKNFPDDYNTNSPKFLKSFLGIDDNSDWPRNEPTALAIKKAAEKGEKALGSLKFNEDTLKLNEQGKKIIAVRKYEHARSAFTQPMINTHLFNGRVYCEFNQMVADEYGTISGRLSSSRPNMQQVPKRNKDIGGEYRKAFLPEKGHIWFDRDYAQQEYVVFADYTQDKTLMEGYNNDPPVDIHTMVANMLGVERDPTAKRMNLGMLYGMGQAKMADRLNVPLPQAKKWINDYHLKIPSARKFLKTAEKRARQRGYVFTHLGRRRRFPNSQFAYKAGNAVIQGSSADITKLKMVEIDEYFASEGNVCRLMLQCHDSLSWSGPDDDEGRRISAEADRIMQDFSSDEAQIKLKVRLKTDADEGVNWSKATYG